MMLSTRLFNKFILSRSQRERSILIFFSFFFFVARCFGCANDLDQHEEPPMVTPIQWRTFAT